ncbi:MAG TPA: MBOAT family O-acyltransferase, partial [Lachnospiraceae bacterium]|nr:MBOAT family O-acyltransferase [Lachnospiraceae bacterium]
ISLSTWFRDYVYIPLGGNRKSKKRTYLNLFLVWLLTGIWHGAGFTFLLWGMLYFVILIFEKSIGLGKKWSLPPVIANIYTMVVVIVGWTIFKSGSLTQALSYLCNMIGIHANGLVDQTTLFYLRDNWMIFVAALVLVTPVGKYLEQKRVLYQLGLALVMIISLIYIIKGNYSPFIYFSF